MRSIVAVSQTLGKRFCEYNGVPVDKLHVIPYGVDVAALDPATAARASALRARLGLGPDHVVVGSVGRLVEQKDYPTQLRAFARAAVHVPALRMVIAGDGPLRSTLEELVRELRLDGRVTLLGNWHDVPALLRSLDAFVLASKFEPFGVALLEAWSAGLAIVATAVNEIPTIVRDGVNGLLTPPENAATMAARFVVLARDRNLRQRLGAEARADARRHSLAAVVHAYERLYDASLEHAIGPAFARSTHA
jgi:glycosyltransferase involved in cell wall biosynthesis